MEGTNRQELLETWYDDYHRQTFGIGFREAAGTPPNLAEAFKRWCATSSLRDKVCIQWKYCEKKRSLGSTAQLATTLADFLASVLGLGTNGALSAALLLVQYGFDSICDCGGDAPVKPPA